MQNKASKIISYAFWIVDGEFLNLKVVKGSCKD
jgi:hypothetical protein